VTEQAERVPTVVGILGAVILLSVVTEATVASTTSLSLDSLWVPGIMMSVPAGSGLLYGGFYLRTGGISPERYRRVLLWCLGGISFFFAFNAVTMVVAPPSDVLSFVSWARWAGSLGAGAGLVVGLVEARAVARERKSVREEEAKTREELLDYLNATLRHEVLNSASAILAHADLIRDQHDMEIGVTEKVTVIERQAQSMTTVIEDVRVLLQASGSTSRSEPIDVTEMLVSETQELRKRYSNVTVETDLPEQAIVAAGPMLRRGFGNLLQNAVEHNDGAHVSVTVERHAEAVAIEIGDDGPGIPELECGHLFDREIRDDANHGLGLALTKTLVQSYDGRVELAETGPEGTTFRIELPRVQEGPEAAAVTIPADSPAS